MKQLIFILSILILAGCKNYSLVGTYYQYSVFISDVTLFPDSTFKAGTGTCMTSADLNGKWVYKHGFIYMKPAIPNDIIYDSLSQSYVYKEAYEDHLKNNMIAVRKYYTNLSPHVFKVKKHKLLLQYKDSLLHIKYDYPFFKIPEDTSAHRKMKRLKRKNEIACSGLSSMQKLLLTLGLIK